jgi:hypothetical protein
MLVMSPRPSAAPEPLACNVNALSAQERDRHDALADKLKDAVTGTRELPNGYEVTLDLGRLPADSRGQAFCVVEVAEWVDMEARCCPFLEFGIDVKGKGGPVTLRLTGGGQVKEFLRTELPLLTR